MSFDWIRRRETARDYFLFGRGLALGLVGLAVFLVLAFGLARPASSAPEPTKVPLVNPIGGTAKAPEGETDLRVIIGRLIKTALGIMGSLALVVFVYGGFMWLTSAGSSEKVQAGGQAMLWAAIGVFIVFSSYAILNLVLEGLGVTQESSADGVSAPGAVWCVDENTNLCAEMMLKDCAGEAFPSEASCQLALDKAPKAVGMWCVTKCANTCKEAQVKSAAEASLFAQKNCVGPGGSLYGYIIKEGSCASIPECKNSIAK